MAAGDAGPANGRSSRTWTHNRPVTVFLRGLIANIRVHPKRIDLFVMPGALLALLDPNPKPRQPSDTNDTDTPIPLSIPVTLKRVALEMRLLVQEAKDDPAPDPALVKLIARTSNMRDLVIREGLSMRELARRITSPYISRAIRLVAKAEQQASQSAHDFVKAEQRLQLQTLRAPIDGTV
jgi:hypothetical protein